MEQPALTHETKSGAIVADHTPQQTSKLYRQLLELGYEIDPRQGAPYLRIRK